MYLKSGDERHRIKNADGNFKTPRKLPQDSSDKYYVDVIRVRVVTQMKYSLLPVPRRSCDSQSMDNSHDLDSENILRTK
jgi:hypothetical protein